jgi:hypothetical protein
MNGNGRRRILVNSRGPALRRAWDARAWADGRPDKVVPEPGVNVQARWLAKLAALGYRDHDRPIQLTLPLAGQVDRDRAAVEVLTRLGAARSAWNAADVRGGVEQLLARAGMVADAAVRRELAEDLTTCALADCVPLLAREVPAHVRSLTSPQVLDVEADLTGRLAVRGTEPTRPGTSSRSGMTVWMRDSSRRSPCSPVRRRWRSWRVRLGRERRRCWPRRGGSSPCRVTG